MMTLKNILAVGAGGALGAVLRFLVSVTFPQNNFPFNTILINICGSFLLGLIAACYLKEQGMNDTVRLFLATGFCGGFTTFSAFSLENMQLLADRKYIMTLIYISASVAGCIIASFAGYKLINK